MLFDNNEYGINIQNVHKLLVYYCNTEVEHPTQNQNCHVLVLRWLCGMARNYFITSY